MRRFLISLTDEDSQMLDALAEHQGLDPEQVAVNLLRPLLAGLDIASPEADRERARRIYQMLCEIRDRTERMEIMVGSRPYAGYPR